jgi:hypothetical protein
MNTSKVMKLLNYENIEVIGSMRNKNIKFPSDIDLQDMSNVQGTYEDIYMFFLNIFNKAYKNKNLFIIDFKCGFYKGKPIKWSYNDMKNGYKMKNNVKITFKYALTHESMIKIDLIAIGKDSLFTEYSCNYYFNFIKYYHVNFTLERDLIVNRLEYDYTQLMKKQKYYKALKRLYSISRIKGNKYMMETLTNMFNSPLGLLYQQKGSLETVVNILTNNFKPYDKDIIIFNLNNIKQHLPIVYQSKIIKIITLKLGKAMIKNIEQLIEQIDDDINNDTFYWINEHDNNIKKI